MQRLEEIRARAEARPAWPDGRKPTSLRQAIIWQLEIDAEFIAHARQDVPALVAALEAVVALHEPEGGPSDPVCCPVCVDDIGMFAESYPCPTVTAIRAALGEEQ